MRLASRTLAAIALASPLLAAALPAAAEPYVIDKAHAQVGFSVNHLGFSIVHGWFRDFDAVIDFDPDAIETAKVAFTIKSASVDTGWDARDVHVKSPDFLDAEAHPDITFVSKSVRLVAGDRAEVTGDVTIKDVTREEVFEVVLNKFGPSPFNPQQTIAGFTVTGTLDRTDYGVSFAAPAVGAEMPIRIDLEASPAG